MAEDLECASAIRVLCVSKNNLALFARPPSPARKPLEGFEVTSISNVKPGIDLQPCETTGMQGLHVFGHFLDGLERQACLKLKEQHVEARANV